jgi:adenylate cyclase
VKRNRVIALGFVVMASSLLAVGIESLGSLLGVTQFENYTLDWRQQTTPESFQIGRGERESDITLVLFDDFSVMDSIYGWDWISPFPRSHIAELVDAIADAGARTIGLDVYLDRLFPGLNAIDRGDERLRRSIEHAGNVILVTPVVQTDSGPVSAPPHDYFAEVAAGVGTAELPAAFETFRDGALAVRSGSGLAPSFALSLYTHFKRLDVDSLLAAAVDDARIELPGLPRDVGAIDPGWRDGTADPDDFVLPFRLRYVGPPSSSDADAQPGTFTALSSGTISETAALLPGYFEDKVVLLGTGFHEGDRFRTPFFSYEPLPDPSLTSPPEQYGWMYGVEVHANALQNMLDGEYVRALGALPKGLLLVIAAALSGGVALRAGAAWGGTALVATIFGIVLYSFWAWAGYVYVLGGVRLAPLGDPYLWIPVSALSLCAIFSYVGSIGYVSVVEGKDKRFIKRAFSRYLHPDVVAHISEDASALQTGGVRQALTLLFSDLSGFTSISEKLDPQALVALLNEYLDEMTNLVLDEEGYVDKYIGDAIMAFWNAPNEVTNHADRAIRTAIAMQRRMAELNVDWGAELPDYEPLRVRIGVHTGEAVIGNVGGKERVNYSAVGDAVNVAARLEPANKAYGTLNMVSEATLAEASGAYRVRYLDYIRVEGKREPVRVYQLIEEANVPIAVDLQEALTLYEEGMSAYHRGDWTAARALFRKAFEACPSDRPSELYMERCERNITDPRGPDWDFAEDVPKNPQKK